MTYRGDIAIPYRSMDTLQFVFKPPRLQNVTLNTYFPYDRHNICHCLCLFSSTLANEILADDDNNAQHIAAFWIRFKFSTVKENICVQNALKITA